MKKRARKNLINRIMEDISENMFQYQGFVLDCVKQTIEDWGDDDLLNWVPEGAREGLK